MTEIKPCPFCGSEAQFESSFSGGPYVLCVECGAAEMFANNEKHAATLWNTRTPDPSLIAGLREAREALENFRLAAEYWAGCDEGCPADDAHSEIMISVGEWPAEAHATAVATLANLDNLLSQEGGQ